MSVRHVINSPADLGATIRAARLREGLTQEMLAEELGVTRQYISKLESGESSLHLDRLFASLRLLGVKLEAREVR